VLARRSHVPKCLADFDGRQSRRRWLQHEQFLPAANGPVGPAHEMRCHTRFPRRGDIEVHLSGMTSTAAASTTARWAISAGSRQCHEPVARLDAADTMPTSVMIPASSDPGVKGKGAGTGIFRRFEDVGKVESGRIHVDQHLPTHGRRVGDLFQGQIFPGRPYDLHTRLSSVRVLSGYN